MRRIAYLAILLLVSFSVANAQTSTRMEARPLLVELGNMLREVPDSIEECQTLVRQIRDWQERKLKDLDEAMRPLRITAPADGAQVSERPFVEGTASDPNAEVWVVVHPMSVSDYWVQPRVNVREDGTWRVRIHIGRPGAIDVGEQFEIAAFVNPEVRMEQGDIFNGWPEAQWKSQIIEVTRR